MEAACSGPNVHAPRAGRSLPKKKSASSSARSAPPGTRVVDHSPARLPVEPAHEAQEAGHRSVSVSRAVGLKRRSRLLQEGLGARHGEAAGAPAGRASQRPPDGRGPAGGRSRAGRVSDDMRPADTQVVEQRSGVGRVVREAHRRGGARAAGLAAPVIPDQAVALDQRLLGQQRQERARHRPGRDQQHRLARSLQLVLQLDLADRGTLHHAC